MFIYILRLLVPWLVHVATVLLTLRSVYSEDTRHDTLTNNIKMTPSNPAALFLCSKLSLLHGKYHPFNTPSTAPRFDLGCAEFETVQ